MPPPSTPPTIPDVVAEVLDEFRRAQGHDVRLWARTPEGWALVGADAEAPVEPTEHAVDVPSKGPAELRLEVMADSPEASRAAAAFLASVVGRLVRHEGESRFFSRELAERYEEITLLYSISEILGSIISLEQAASTILTEVAGTLRVHRVALWIHNVEREALELVAAVGAPGQQGPISVADAASVTAAVFRDRRPVILEPGDEFPRGDTPPELATRGSFLSVPVSYTPPDGETRTIGVINLIGRGAGHSFSAGDQKLIMAIASQIGAAVENSRLVAASLRQERLVRELELAHDLQLKLLPSVEQFNGYAEVAARCVPAESVGGDFYHLFRLPGGRIGVMIGDVSSHGFGAALIMALTMSAVAIHASEGDSPAEVLRRTHLTLIDELETTEMYLTLFYGVIDPVQGLLTYANAGHSHAFRVDGQGQCSRLAATNPPLGIVDLDTYSELTAPWVTEQDLLFLFTDGLSDALGLGEVAGEQRLLQEASAALDEPVGDILQRIYELEAVETGVPADDRTAVLVRV